MTEYLYPDFAPQECPFCGDSDCWWGPFDIDSEVCWQVGHCNKCGRDWNELYRFHAVEYEPPTEVHSEEEE